MSQNNGREYIAEKMIYTNDPNYDPFKNGHHMLENNTPEKSQLEKITETLERIEKRFDQLTGPTLTNGIWR